ncbi:Hsp20 family protein [Vibrio sp. B1FLJ16]|uniref:Hsp20 family protein n=1 Tax=Vibrio sp. B1FLJ16 TaxID=2751178 RepID=UPI0015F54C07|nr:Hsp20 family protein [Vibrio sp. B1FLJ16]MCA0938047.1 Hsp20 family protein [Vibrio alginolyticus]CAD7796482.1 Belongs to the small heat shock protein (HSP20) family [Vibrio sp. B1FLJ16]CAD7796496.1 Belongs to the small heat shock protein (HSP20) family [Vibrio sp. B1FLJ16]CAE6877644.1 Belongs to the small heat shock protein (HSP20) family [Vibrio sp. B1FLJ16]CAE6878430.1 Belongs to the small heat shock protein (HSP20) family [Vibrio sp. B1FLJ16]
MRNVDFSPLYRNAIGFDRLLNLMEAGSAKNSSGGYPPYNIEQKDEHNFRITMAVAGFAEEQLDLTQNENMLIVKGERKEEENKNYVYQGIAERDFERKFQLADYVKVTGASMENGLLHIDLVREIPEAMQPRKIAIGGGNLLENN